MQIGTRVRYGMLAMMSLANNQHEAARAEDIGRLNGISKGYLEGLLAMLRRAGLVHALRGPGGGWVLSKNPSKITALDIYKTLEGETHLAPCAKDASSCPTAQKKCNARNLWVALSGTLTNALDSVSLSVLAGLEAPRIKKTTAKKAVKKTTKKASTKKPAKKKVAKKSAVKKTAKKASTKKVTKKVAKKSTSKKVAKKPTPKKAVKKAAPKKSVAKKITKKVAKKAATKKTTQKPVSKKATKKAASKVTKKTAAPKKVVSKKTATKKVVAKKTTKKTTKKVVKKASKIVVAPKRRNLRRSA